YFSKKEVVQKTATADDLKKKKLQFPLKKLRVNSIFGIEEMTVFTNEGAVIHFNNLKAKASLVANIFTLALWSCRETKQMTEMLPSILNQLGDWLKHCPNNLWMEKKHPLLLEKDCEGDDDEVPDLVEIFNEVSKNEANN
ncbi:Transcription factor BTF3, partial [Galemys pyrenaicus]